MTQDSTATMSRESRLIIFVAVLASLLEIIDVSIVNVALPSIMGNLGATLDEVSMVITGYAIANAVILPVSAWLGDRIGRRKYFLGCILLFTGTSILCGIAPNLTCLVIFRIFQGLAGGALLPTSQTLIYEQYPKEKAGTAGAVFGMSVMVGPALGPVMGGYLTDTFGWRTIFNINLPLGLLAFFIGWIVIKNPAHQKAMHEDPNKPQFDWIGLSLLVAGIGCLQYVLERGNANDWFADTGIVVNTIISATCIPAFIWWELKTQHPILNLRLFKESIVRNGIMLMALLGFFLYGVVFLMPVFLGRMYNYDATQIGEFFIPGSLLTMMMMPIIGKLMQSGKNPKVLILIGFVGLEVCCFMMTRFSPLSSKQEILRMLYMRGFAISFLFVPINSTILGQMKGQSLGQTAGMLNLFRQLGGSIGIAFGATTLTTKSHQHYTDLSGKLSSLSIAAQNSMTQITASMAHKMTNMMGNANPHQAALKVMMMRIQTQVFMLSFIQLVEIMMIVIAFAIIPIVFIKIKRGPTKIVDAH
jgi:DHA2 family multidrug resistance protein